MFDTYRLVAMVDMVLTVDLRVTPSTRARWLTCPDPDAEELFRMVGEVFIFWSKSHVSFINISPVDLLGTKTQQTMNITTTNTNKAYGERLSFIKSYWIFHVNVWNRDTVTANILSLSFSLAVSPPFRSLYGEQNFKREEQNFVVMNEINNMSFLTADSKSKMSKVRPSQSSLPRNIHIVSHAMKLNSNNA